MNLGALPVSPRPAIARSSKLPTLNDLPPPLGVSNPWSPHVLVLNFAPCCNPTKLLWFGKLSKNGMCKIFVVFAWPR